jgi:hypothetical protein
MTIGKLFYRAVQLAAVAGVVGILATAASLPAAADEWHHHWRNAGGWDGHDRDSLALQLAPGNAPYPYDTPPPAFVVPPRLYNPPGPPTPYYAPALYPRPSDTFTVHINSISN